MAVRANESDAEGLREAFKELDWGRCSVGEPRGPGLKMGFEGWGQPDVLLDPVAPLDFQVSSLGLSGAFDEVESYGLAHRLHGDCTLTHGIEGLGSLVKPGGVLVVGFLSMPDVMGMALENLRAGDYARAQVLEKVCFGQPADKAGILYPQTLLSKEKLGSLLCRAGFMNMEVIREPSPELPPAFPDLFRLEGIEDKVWEGSAMNFREEDNLRKDRPTCVLCDRVVTKRDHDRKCFSRYCKDHYYEARTLCDESLRSAFLCEVRATKPNGSD